MKDFFRNKAFHPYLYSLIPVIDLFIDNRSKVHYFDLIFSFCFVGAMIAIASIVFKTVFRDRHKNGMFLIVLIFLTFSFGAVYNWLNKYRAANYLFGAETNLLILTVLLMIAVAVILKRIGRPLSQITLFLNIYALVLLLISSYNVGLFEIERNRLLAKAKDNPIMAERLSDKKDRFALAGKEEERPDIYYIILDTYARADTLEKIYDFDNGSFIEELEDRGLTVSDSSSSNYVFTQLSLASSLNMEYIDYVPDLLGRGSKNPTVPYKLIINNRVMKFLKTRGYTNIFFSTGWGPTKRSDQADIGYDYLPYVADEFNRVLMESTAFRPLSRPFFRAMARRRILFNFDRLAGVARMEEPTFAFVHFILPHQPYIFDENGGPVSIGRFEMGGDVWSYKDPYLDQVKFTNKKVLETVDRILRESKEPPIIIIQADHGPSSTHGWANPSDRLINERLNILSAFYLPDEDKNLFKEKITPVNYFRVIFNRYLDTDFEILENKSYFSTKVRPHDFIDVTDRLE